MDEQQTKENEERIFEKLFYIHTDFGSDPWVEIGKSLKSLHWKCGDNDWGLGVWNDWSKRNAKGYTNFDDLTALWNAFGDDGSINRLFEIAESLAARLSYAASLNLVAPPTEQPIFGYDETTGLIWLHDTEENAVWYAALVAVDAYDDTKPLIKLLQSGQPVPPSIAFYLGDMLDRYTLRRPKARPRTPAYTRTPEQIKLLAAVTYVYGMVHQDGVQPAIALQQIAASHGLDEETLTAAYFGKHGGLQRARQRWFIRP